MKRFAATLLVLAACDPSAAQTVLFVDADAAGAADGSSWTDAYSSLADALAASTAGDQIWVVAGTYRPDEGVGLNAGDRTLSFNLKSGVRVHGGFAGGESSLGDRSHADNPTVLSGDLAGDDDGFSLADDNSYHVVRATDTSDDTLLEGFVVTGGRADGTDADSLGGGILIEGGSPWIMNTRFNSNKAGCGGGIAVSDGGTPSVVNAVVNGNTATVGGGVCALVAGAELLNATISNNTARRAPGIYNSASDLDVVNSIIAGNMPFDEAAHCEVWQYPCSIMDESEEVRTLTSQLMAEAYEIAASGGMSAAITYLENHPNIVQSFGNDVTVGARVAGGSIAFLSDARNFLSEVGKSTPHFLSGSTAGPIESRISRLAGKANRTPGGRTILGQDTNGDGVINNRDDKYALVLSPFDISSGFTIRGILGNTPGYGINVDYAGNPQFSGDYSLDNWLFWSDYEYVYVSTWNTDIPTVDGGRSTAIVTGIPVNSLTNDFPLRYDGVGFAIPMNTGNPQVDGQNMIVLTGLFFRSEYADLNDVLIHCAFCSLLLGGGDASSASLSWVGSLPELVADESSGITYEVAEEAATELMTQLSFGRSVGEAIQRLSNASVRNNFGVTTLASSARDVRITERPQLTYDPERRGVATLLTDFMDVSELVDGTIGDEENDLLVLTSIVRGLANVDDSQNRQPARVLVDDEEKDFQLVLSEISSVPDTDDALAFVPIVAALGFPLESGRIMEVVLEMDIGDGALPGVSSYSAVVTVDAFSCNGRVRFGGFRNGAFTGVANLNRNPADGAATLALSSSQEVLSFPFPELKGGAANMNVFLSLSNERQDPNDDITIYDVDFAILNNAHFANIWWSSYIADDPPCAECPAFVTIDSTGSDGVTLHGSFEFTGEDVTGTNSDKRVTTISGNFRALPGSNIDSTTPYFSCLEEYWDTAETYFN